MIYEMLQWVRCFWLANHSRPFVNLIRCPLCSTMSLRYIYGKLGVRGAKNANKDSGSQF